MTAPVQNVGALVRGARLRFRYLYEMQDAIDPALPDPDGRRHALLMSMRRIVLGLDIVERARARGDFPRMFRVLQELQQ